MPNIMLKPNPVSANPNIVVPYYIRDAGHKVLHSKVLGKGIISQEGIIALQPMTRGLCGVTVVGYFVNEPKWGHEFV